MELINKLILLDDSKATNSRNKSLLASTNKFKEIISYSDPMELLNYLESLCVESLPEMMFLDIEMPKINCFEFLEKYIKIDAVIASEFKPYLIILSDHLFTDKNFDTIKSYSSIGVEDQIKKPIDKSDILSMLEEYFDKDFKR